MKLSGSIRILKKTPIVFRVSLMLLLVLSCVSFASRGRAVKSEASEALPSDFDSDSKHLVVHGPFHYPPEGSSNIHSSIGPRFGQPREADDDGEEQSQHPCTIPTDCPGMKPSRPNSVPDSPVTRTAWTWPQAIGNGDPQIAAGPNFLVVSAYQTIAYLNKTDGQFLPMKQPILGVRPNGVPGIKRQGKVGQLPRTTPISTNDLFAPILADINKDIDRSINLDPTHATTSEIAEHDKFMACQREGFDCHLNDFYDTRVIYDEYRDRFWVVSLTISADIAHRKNSAGAKASPLVLAARRGKLAVAVSATPDPRDGWNLYWWDSIPNDGNWSQAELFSEHAADYPSVGISPKYFLEEHAAGLFHGASAHISIVEAEPLARGERPGPGLRSWEFWNVKNPDGAKADHNIQPVVHHGELPSVFAAAFTSTYCEGDHCFLMIYYFNDTVGGFLRALVPIKSFFAPRDAPQPSTESVSNPFNFQLSNTGNSVMKAAFEKGRIFATFNDCRAFPGSQGCVTSVRLVRIRVGDPSVVEVDQSIGDRFPSDPDSSAHIFFGLPSVEVNKAGDAALIFMRVGQHVSPEAAYAVLLHNANEISPGRTLHAGTAPDNAQFEACKKATTSCSSTCEACDGCKSACSKPERDLDTAAISVDPQDDSIWIGDGYVDSNGFHIAVGKILGRISARPVRRAHAIGQDNCAGLTNELNALKSSRARLQDNLQRATGTDRQSFLQQIKELDAEIQEKQRQLNRCVVHYEVRPSQTDPKINDPNRLHEVYVRADGFGDLLFMFFPGSPQQPSEFKKLLETAARAGYHVIGVDYPNQEGELRTICDNRPGCYGQLRREVVEGRDVSPQVAINTENCILNRAVKLLQWLDVNHPKENWGQFLNSGQIRWSKVTVAGHSQGGGYAAMIARLFQVHRVVMFSSVTDATNGPSGFLSAPWLTQPRETPHDRYYGFGNTEDNLFFPQIETNWTTLALSGIKTDVDTFPAPYSGSHRLTTSNDSQHSGTPIHRHNLVVTDKDTPLESNGEPVYLAVWRYLIGP